MKLRALIISASIAILAAACGQGAKEAEGGNDGPSTAATGDGMAKGEALSPDVLIDGLAAGESVADFRAGCDAALAAVRDEFTALENYRGPMTVDAAFRPLDELSRVLLNGRMKASLLQEVHTDPEMRNAAEACDQEFAKLGTEIGMSRPLFELAKAVDVTAADAPVQFLHMKTLRDFKRAGVDKDEATREKIRTLNDEITKLGQDFGRNIREDVREIMLDSADDLKGLPEDYIAAKQPGPDGKIRINTDYPDYVPFMTYADNDAARKALRLASRSRAYPANEAVLKDLLQKRYELAQLLGYPNYAAYVMDDKMVGNPERAAAFINDIAATVKDAAERDKAVLLTRLKEIDPAASEVGVWQYSYLQEKVRLEQFALDSKELRSYFQFSKVQAGIFDLTRDLFGVTIKPWDTPVWEKSVTAWELYEGERLIGRFYLDLHPRDGKYKHAAHFPIRLGVAGKQIPMSALVCNFPGGDDPNALMEHDDVVTYLHEFGHLLHHMLGGQGAWTGNSGVATEWDFVEAPSQLLEEWAYDYDTLKRFAVNGEGKTIPKELVDQLNRARFFGRGIDTGIQTFYAAMSLEYYNKDPKSFDLLQKMIEIENKYAPFGYLDGSYFFANFGHLDGYSAIYYTYQWSLAIAHDLFGRFKTEGMRRPEISLAYRRAVLDPGGAAPADELAADFLGRPWTVDAYKAWLIESK